MCQFLHFLLETDKPRHWRSICLLTIRSVMGPVRMCRNKEVLYWREGEGHQPGSKPSFHLWPWLLFGGREAPDRGLWRLLYGWGVDFGLIHHPTYVHSPYPLSLGGFYLAVWCPTRGTPKGRRDEEQTYIFLILSFVSSFCVRNIYFSF